LVAAVSLLGSPVLRHVPIGRRQRVIAGEQAGDDETQIMFKVLEHKTRFDAKLGILRITDKYPRRPSTSIPRTLL
jgi:hypothetical protein